MDSTTAGGAWSVGAVVRRPIRLGATIYLYVVVWVVAVVAVAALLGFRPVVVSSGSMTPALHRGDLLLSAAPPDDILPGTVVTFERPGDGRLLTHRVVEVAADGALVTQGDANPTADSTPVDRADVVGVSRFAVPLVGAPALWWQERSLGVLALWAVITAVAASVAAGPAHPAPRRAPRPALPRIRVRRPRVTNRSLATVLVVELVAIGLVLVSLPSGAAFSSTTVSSGNALAAAEWDKVVSLTAGHSKHNCAAKTEGTVFCWGVNNQSQLGDGTGTDRSTPVQVLGAGGVGVLTGVSAVTGGSEHTCARKADGTVWCWGRNDKGQLGDGTLTNRSTPVQVRGVGGVGFLTGVTRVHVGHKHSCAVRTDTSIVCWGQNTNGQVGDGTTTDRTSPVAVLGVGGVGTLSGVVEADGGETHTCALRSDASVVCWGRNNQGQLGDGTTTDRSSPVVVTGVGGVGALGGVAGIAAGFEHTCARATAQTMWCWGVGADGSNGNGSTSDRSSPVVVVGVGGVGTLTGVVRFDHGDKHVCAVRTDTSVVCWGRNSQRQLGDGSTTDRSSPVVVLGPGGVGNLSGAELVAAGGEHSCAALANRTVRCWGRNDKGQIGDGTLTDRSFPTVALLPT